MNALLLAGLLFAQLEPLPPNLVALDSDQGRALLLSSKANRAYFALSSQFVTQDTRSYCGVAASVMVLNAMPIEAPIGPWAPFRLFTQDNVFTGSQVPVAQVRERGMTVESLAALLRDNHAEVVAVHAADSSLADFRTRAKAALEAPNHYVVVDFSRPALHQDVGAHWSPLGAYEAKSDRFLVLDVARFRYPPYWATASDLFAAMNTVDSDSGKTRGFLLVDPAPGAPPRSPVAPLSAPSAPGK